MREDAEEPDGAAVRVRCDCGNWLEADARAQRVTCECGRPFAVTITDLSSTTVQYERTRRD